MNMSDFNWDFPYPSKRMPIMGKNMVATSQPLAAQAGLSMLRRGGNAVDAAIATAIALTVVEPTSNGLGSDAFALVWDNNRLHGLNASGRSPAAWTYDHFSEYTTMPRLGWDTVTVPGAVSAWMELSERFGILRFEELFEPAIQYASLGFMVSPITARMWAFAPEKYRDYPDLLSTFLIDGHSPGPGELFRNLDQARSLECIAKTHGESFYFGRLAEEIASHSHSTGGLLTVEDLASHTADWVDPISMDYRGHTLHEIPPNGQGIAALQMLGILEGYDIAHYPVDSTDSLHLQIEAMKLAFADTHRYVSDQKWKDVEFKALLEKSYLSERSKLIEMGKANDPGYGTPGPGGTVYLTAADENGMMVSYIQSNYMGFGSGIVIPGTGIALQNRGTGFSLEKGHPNQVDSGKRPFHTIIPAFVTETDTGEPRMSFGVMGGPMQPQGHAQMMIRMFDYQQNPQTAVDAPRWQVFPEMEVAVEPGFQSGVLDELTGRGHRINTDREFWWFGGAQMIYKTMEGYIGASDPRKDGQAVGF